MRYIFLMFLVLSSILSFSQKRLYGELSNKYDRFDDIFKSWNVSSYGLGYLDSGKVHVIGRVNRLNRQYLNDNVKKSTQLELDIYPTYNKGYMWVSLAYSPDSLFPTYRSVFEIYRELPYNFEMSLGYRNNYTINETFIQNLTVSLGMYHGNMWSYMRVLTSHSDKTDDISFNYSMGTRYYFKGKYDYIGATLLRGIDDKPRFYTLNTNDTYMIRLDGKKSLNDNIKLSLGVGYTKQYMANRYINSIGIDLGIIIII